MILFSILHTIFTQRIEYVKKEYLPHAPLAELRILETEASIAKARNNADLIKDIEARKAHVQKSHDSNKQKNRYTAPWKAVTDFFTEDNVIYFEQ